MKPRPNHGRYILVLRCMTPEERLEKAFELSEFARALFLHGLEKRFPDRSPEALRRLVRDRLQKCHNGNF